MSYFSAKEFSMKKLIPLALLIIIISSCKPDSKQSAEPPLTTVEKIAKEAGFESWDSISQVKFTFEVGKAGRALYQRHWLWDKKTNNVTLKTKTDTVTYNRNLAMDSIQKSADRAFVNDVYWLIPEFKFTTDQGTEIIEKADAVAPISKDTLDMFTIIYGGDGGYTPGDAYDVYYDKDYKLKEWAYRQGNDTTVYMMTTFEKFETYNGVTIAKDHRTPERMTRIYLRNIEFTK